MFKDQDKDNDLSSKDKDKDKDCIVKDKDQDKDCILVLKESLRTRTRTNITGYISEMVEDRWVHAARRLTSIEFSFDPCNIYRDGPRGVGYPADVRSVGDSHPSCYTAATWPGVEPRIYDTLVRRSTSKPPVPRATLTLFSRTGHSLTLNISQTATDTAIVTTEGE